MKNISNYHDKNHIEFYLVIVLAIFAFGINAIFGSRGFMPLDQSIVFDAGYRIANGQLPFKDFVIPFGLVPSYLQGGIFKIFGVSAWSYLIHACIFNMFFALIIFQLGKQFNLPFKWAWLTAVFSAICFYPPIGLPYMEQHSYFFLALALLLSTNKNLLGMSKIRVFIVAVLFGLAWFSKQMPASAFFPVIALSFLYGSEYHRTGLYNSILFSIIVIIGAGIIYYLTQNTTFALYYFSVPSQLGVDRFHRLYEPSIIHSLFATIDGTRLHVPMLVSILYSKHSNFRYIIL